MQRAFRVTPGDVRFFLVCLALLAAGGLLRLHPARLLPASPGSQALPTPVPAAGLAVSGDAAGASDAEAVPSQVAHTVQRFYELLVRGQYEEAYRLTLEVKWQADGSGGQVATGLVSGAEFAARLNSDMARTVGILQLLGMWIRKQSPLPLEGLDIAQRPELFGLRFLPPGISLEALYRVQVTGNLVLTCQPWNWERQVIVARLSDGSHRLLLPGHPAGRQENYEDYFSPENFLAGQSLSWSTP